MQGLGIETVIQLIYVLLKKKKYLSLFNRLQKVTWYKQIRTVLITDLTRDANV